ncbi:MAG: S41 family peptidase [Phycisphaerales bacterium]
MLPIFVLVAALFSHSPALTSVGKALASLVVGATTELPDTPQGRCAADWFKVVASGAPEDVRRFETTYRSPARLAETSVDVRVGRLAALRQEFGAFSLTDVRSASAARIDLAAKSTAKGDVTLAFVFDANGKLDAIEIASGGGPGPQPLDADRRAQLVSAAAKAVRDEYVFPEKGAAMSDAVTKAASAGAYDAIADDVALADRLTQDLRAVTNDRHLRVRVASPEQVQQRSHALGATDDEMRRANWQFKSCSIEPGNIGVLRFDGFVPEPEAMKVLDAAFAFLARCDALVLDIRANGGGSPEMLDHIAGYLFDKPVLLNRMIDRNGSVVGEGYSDESVPGQRFAADLPVFVVTSSRTFSCAEEFAYDLQALKRATIVGETTGGGAHPVKPVMLDDRMVVIMPYMRANNPITQTNWEGVGVKSDVEVPAEQALERAIELARKHVAERRVGSPT